MKLLPALTEYSTAWASQPLAWIPTQAGLSVPASLVVTPDASRIAPYSAPAFRYLNRQHHPSSRGCKYVSSLTIKTLCLFTVSRIRTVHLDCSNTFVSGDMGDVPGLPHLSLFATGKSIISYPRNASQSLSKGSSRHH